MSTSRSRGSRISRVIEYFKSTEIEEARIVWTRVNEIMSDRLGPPKRKRVMFKHKDMVRTVSAPLARAAHVGEAQERSIPGGE